MGEQDAFDGKREQAASSYNRRDFLTRLGAASGIAAAPSLMMAEALPAAPSRESDVVIPPAPENVQGKIFPTGLEERKWLEFPAAGFSHPVSGAIFRASHHPCCGVPIGGLDTGCIDIDARGTYGFSTIFNPISPCPAHPDWRMNRKAQLMQPILGLAIGPQTWVLADAAIINGGEIPVCQDPRYGKVLFQLDKVTVPKLEGVKAARQIHYWGHYPVADLEYETDAPVGVGLRAWASFLPGDAAGSNIPAAVFEVHLRNTSAHTQQGTLALNFPGPDAQEALGAEFTREPIAEDYHGVMVASAGGVNYILGVMGEEKVRWGSGLNQSSTAWSKIATELPVVAFRESKGRRVCHDGSSSAAVDFSLVPGSEKIVRFLLAWFAPVCEGARKEFVDGINEGRKRGVFDWLAETSWKVDKFAGDTNHYTHMYATRYASARDVARRMATEHESLLQRVLAWQSTIYTDTSLPPWLRDSLVNILCLIAETGLWVEARPPLGDSFFPGGAFALNECPRGCPHLANIPCDWYGNLPIVYFFPELALSTLRLYKQHQREDGATPFAVGALGDLPDFVTPAYDWQISLNGTCYVDLVDRLWQRTGDDAVVREFYDSVKRSNTFVMNLRLGHGGVISMPKGNKGMEWFERGEWRGMCTHLGGLHLAQLRIMERMAKHMGDQEYAKQCSDWLADGSQALEEELWAGNCYLNFYEKETGKKSDDVMAFQLDGQWAALFHGLPGVFRSERVLKTLETVRQCNIKLTPEVGAASFTRPGGGALAAESKVADYGPYAMFTCEIPVLGMTYIYAGQKDIGLELVRRHWENNALRHNHAWDTPNLVRGDTGERVYGTDYYQNMMLWAMPAALNHQNLAEAAKPGGLVDHVINAAKTGRSIAQTA